MAVFLFATPWRQRRLVGCGLEVIELALSGYNPRGRFFVQGSPAAPVLCEQPLTTESKSVPNVDPEILVARDTAAMMREETNEMRLWREAAQRRRGINPPIDPHKNERLTPEGGRITPAALR
jgi:hypothetical protein